MKGRSRASRRVAVALALAAFGGGAIGAVALADTQPSPPITVRVFPKVTPNRAGTPAHPQGVHLDVRLTIGIPVNYSPPLVQTIDVWFPRGGVYNGAKFPTCSYQRLNAAGPRACPPESIMGRGSGVARADETFTYPKITLVNGGQQRVYAYTVLNNPARVQAPVVGTITKLSGRWSYRLHIVIPRVLQVVAGVPIVLRSLSISGGRGDWIATTSCPSSHRWPFHAITRFNDGQSITTDGSVGCR
jgi:hypothetical protein